MQCAESACFFGREDSGVWECFFYILFNFSAAVRLRQGQRLFAVLIHPHEPGFDCVVYVLQIQINELFVGSQDNVFKISGRRQI